mmetsp:Transcript_21643/g.57460  ORF Transcript_21643/g.57460 Transcript_21643/m.57460 type:complete len:90 (-) Transcript_21643:756-1025(-)
MSAARLKRQTRVPSPVSQVQSYVDSQVKMELKLGPQTCHSTGELSVFTPSHHRLLHPQLQGHNGADGEHGWETPNNGIIAWRHRAKKHP